MLAETDLQTAEQFENVIIANGGSYPVRLKDVGRGGTRRRTTATRRVNGKVAVGLGIVKQSTANPLDGGQGGPGGGAAHPPEPAGGHEAQVAFDSSVFIDASIKAVYRTIAEAMMLVALVIFFFLRSFRATLIPFVTIPVSLIGAFALMAVRVHDQHADAARYGACDRPRRRRRDRGAGEHLPAHRGGHAAGQAAIQGAARCSP